MNGALLVHKHAGVTSFGVIEVLQKSFRRQLGPGHHKRDLPKMGHGGTLDPFATGLLLVLVGPAVKLARYFLGSTKIYEGVIRFGETTVPGDPTDPICATSEVIPESITSLNDLAHRLTLQPYLQIPPMHSAKKKDGKPLYKLARAGIEVDRQPNLCHLYEFDFLNYSAPRGHFRVKCSSGTYIRKLAQDFGNLMGSVALLESLHRTASGAFAIENAWSLDQILAAAESRKKWDELDCWIPFNQLLSGYHRATADPEERRALVQGKQHVLFNILKRSQSPLAQSNLSPSDHTSDGRIAIYCADALVAVACKKQESWAIERVFT